MGSNLLIPGLCSQRRSGLTGQQPRVDLPVPPAHWWPPGHYFPTLYLLLISETTVLQWETPAGTFNVPRDFAGCPHRTHSQPFPSWVWADFPSPCPLVARRTALVLSQTTSPRMRFSLLLSCYVWSHLNPRQVRPRPRTQSPGIRFWAQNIQEPWWLCVCLVVRDETRKEEL